VYGHENQGGANPPALEGCRHPCVVEPNAPIDAQAQLLSPKLADPVN
jgi:hypothetical protein